MSICYAYPSPDFIPAMRLIYDITNEYPAVVLTTRHTELVHGAWVAVPEAHGYGTGLIVRLHIPVVCGMPELHDYVGKITVINDTAFSINVDTTNFTQFHVPGIPDPIWADICAQIIPVAEDTLILTQATRNRLG